MYKDNNSLYCHVELRNGKKKRGGSAFSKSQRETRAPKRVSNGTGNISPLNRIPGSELTKT